VLSLLSEGIVLRWVDVFESGIWESGMVYDEKRVFGIVEDFEFMRRDILVGLHEV
jgi:hypothetical protein